MKAKKHLLVSLLVLLMLCTMSFSAVACGGSDGNDAIAEMTGSYYFDAGLEEWTLDISADKVVVFKQGEEELLGTYSKLNDLEATVAFAGVTGSSKLSYTENMITLEYKGNVYNFYKEVYFDVAFVANGGTLAVEEVEVLNGKKLELPEDPKKPGHDFVAWCMDEQCQELYDVNAPVTGNMTLYAYYVAVEEGQLQYVVSFESNAEGYYFKDQKTVAGKVYNLPVIDNELFVGWWLSDAQDAEKLTAQYTDQVLNENTTLYGVWKEDKVLNVSVSEQQIKWNAAAPAASYRIKITAPDGTVEDKTLTGLTYTYDFAAKEAGEYKVEVNYNNQFVGTAYYNNKQLDTVSLFEEKDGVVSWNAVKNAQAYVLKVVCGNPAHDHAAVELGEETSYNFANCQMTKEGVSFEVTAKAEGYMDSVSKTYVVVKNLDAVSGLEVDEDAEKLTWNAVANATSYVVKVVAGGQTYEETVLNTEFSIKNYNGQLVLSVYPVANGYNSPEAQELQYNKEKLLVPTGVKLQGSVLTWETVDGAQSYNVKVDGQVKNVTAATLDLADLLNGKTTAKVSVQAVGNGEIKDSAYTEEFVLNVSTLGEEIAYKAGVLSWNYVVNADYYEVSVNNGEATKVTTNFAEVVLTQAGNNTLSVRFVDGETPSEWLSMEVFAYEIEFDVQNEEEIAPMYKAVGDKIELPTPAEKVRGYEFDGWYNIPGGAPANGLEYVDTVFQGNQDLVLYAYWNPNEYLISIKGDNNTVVMPSQTDWLVSFDGNYTLPVLTSKDTSKVFYGWYDEPNGQGFKYTNAYGNNELPWGDVKDMTLYPGWVDILKFEEIPGAGEYSVKYGDGISYVTEVTVPATYKDLPVTTIYGSAFDNCSKIEVMNIPNTVKLIQFGTAGGNGAGSAFKGCSKLANVNVYAVEGNHDVIYKSVEGVLFVKENKHANNTVTSTEEDEFWKLVYYPYGRPEGPYTVPEGTQTLATAVFQSTKVSEVIIPSCVVNIESSAFYLCSKLTKVTFLAPQEGEEVAPLYIMSKAFRSCSTLTAITLPTRLKNLDVSSFESASKLAEINFEGEVTEDVVYTSIDGMVCTADKTTIVYCPLGKSGSLRIPLGVKTIGKEAFYNNKNLTEIIIPGWVTTIGENAFKSCTGLVNVEFEGKETDDALTIDLSAFYGCTGLTQVTLPANLKTLKKNAFGGITGLLTVNVNSTTELNFEVDAFANTAGTTYVTTVNLGPKVEVLNITGVFGASKLAAVNVDRANNNYASGDVEHNDDGVLYDKAMTEIVYYPISREGNYVLRSSITKIGESVFEGKKGITEILIHANVTEIGASAFKGCANLAKVEFENGETPLIIGSEAFRSCSKLTEVILPGRCTTLGEYAFSNCSGLLELEIPEGVKNIGNYAFNYASKLKSITLPASVEKLGSYDDNGALTQFNVFDYCNALQTISVHDDNKLYADVDGILYLKDADGKVKELFLCPIGKEGKVTVPSTVTKVWGKAFYNNEKVQEVYFEDLEEGSSLTFDMSGMTYGGIFYYCDSLVSVRLPKGLDVIPANLFYYSSLIEYVYVPNTVHTIEGKAFYYLPKLKEVEFEPGNDENYLSLADGESSSDNYGAYYYGCFYGCKALKTIDLPLRTTYIGDYALSNAQFNSSSTSVVNVFYGLESITIPANVTEIGEYAFYHCRNLASLTFAPNSKLKIIGKYGFAYCGIEGELDLPESLETLRPYAFSNNNKITKVEIPASVTGLGVPAVSTDTTTGRVFYMCSALEEVTFAEGSQLTMIGAYNFYQAKKLASIEIPATVEEIGTYAFSGCTALAEVKFLKDENGKSALKEIGNNCFASTSLTKFEFPESEANIDLGTNLFTGCTKLTSVYLSSSVVDIDNVFAGCNSITKITIPEEGHANFATDETLPILYNANGTAIHYIYGLLPAGEFIVPEGVKEIAPRAFENQNRVTKITLPSTLLTIGSYAFSACTNLEEVVFAKDCLLNKIDTYAFQKCYALESITLPAKITNIGMSAFRYCESLKSVEITSTPTTFGTYIFADCTSLENVTLNDNMTKLGNYMFYNCYALKEVKLPSKLTATGTNTFQNSGLTKITIPAGVTKLDNVLFSGCEDLAEVNLPTGLKEIGNTVFKGCTSLESIIIPEKCIKVGSGVFHSTGLKTIDISMVTTIGGSQLFTGCDYLATVIISPDLITMKGSTFLNCVSLTTVCVGEYTEEKKGIIDLSNITTFGTSEFSGAELISNVILSENLAQLNSTMFQDCTSLTQINVPNSVAWLGKGTFQNSGLTSFTMPTSTLNTRYSATAKDTTLYSTTSSNAANVFLNCVNLTTVVLHPDFYGFGGNTFEGCTSLTTIGQAGALQEGKVILTGVRYLGNKLFLNSGVTSVDASDASTYTYIGSYVFEGCASLAEVKLSDDLAQLKPYMFRYCTSLETIALPTAMTTTGTYTFTESGLKSFTYTGTKWTTLGNYAFQGTSMENVVIPESVTSIGSYSFDGTPLKNLTIGSKVTTINNYAFRGTQLLFVDIPAKVATINQGAFADCDQLAGFNVDSNNTKFFSQEGALISSAGKLVCYPAGLEGTEGVVEVPNILTIGPAAFEGCDLVKKIILLDGHTTIPNYAFDAATALEEVVIPEGVTEIGTYAFRNTPNLQTVILPETVTTLKMNTFQNSGIKSFVIPESVTSFTGNYFFAGSGIEEIVIPESITKIDNYMFDGSALKSITLHDGITDIGNYAFRNTKIKSFNFPANLETLGGAATSYTYGVFFGCTELEEIYLPGSLANTVIVQQTFSGCTSLRKVEIGEGFTKIPNKTFQNCTALKEVIFPENGAVEIGQYAFDNTGLEEIDLTKGVGKIGQYAFSNCLELKKVILPAQEELSAYMFKNSVNLETVVIGEGTEKLAYEIFYGCTNIKSLYIPESVTNIGRDNFNLWTAEQTVYFACEEALSSTWNSMWADDCQANFVWNYKPEQA